MFRTRATTLLGIIFPLHRILPFFLINFLTNPLHCHPIQLLPLKPTGQNLLHIFYLMKCPLPSAYPACIIAVILREFALFFSFYNLSTILAYKTIFIIKSFRGGVILHTLLFAGGGSLYVISIFLIHDIRIYEPQSGSPLQPLQVCRISWIIVSLQACSDIRSSSISLAAICIMHVPSGFFVHIPHLVFARRFITHETIFPGSIPAPRTSSIHTFCSISKFFIYTSFISSLHHLLHFRS